MQKKWLNRLTDTLFTASMTLSIYTLITYGIPILDSNAGVGKITQTVVGKYAYFLDIFSVY